MLTQGAWVAAADSGSWYDDVPCWKRKDSSGHRSSITRGVNEFQAYLGARLGRVGTGVGILALATRLAAVDAAVPGQEAASDERGAAAVAAEALAVGVPVLALVL